MADNPDMKALAALALANGPESDHDWTMIPVQSESVTNPPAGFAFRLASPLDRPDVAPWVVAVLRRVDAMGLIEPDPSRTSSLGVEQLVGLLRAVSAAGIAVQPIAGVGDAAEPAALRSALRRIDQALRESPSPRTEWPRARAVLQSDLLGRLLGVSPSSLQRYCDGRRETPAVVADRLHFLALLSGDLLGAYNELGVRLWFDRPRVTLGGKAPATLLTADWRPDDPGPSRVRSLAASLVAPMAT
jgi:hypothetical protein